MDDVIDLVLKASGIIACWVYIYGWGLNLIRDRQEYKDNQN